MQAKPGERAAYFKDELLDPYVWGVVGLQTTLCLVLYTPAYHGTPSTLGFLTALELLSEAVLLFLRCSCIPQTEKFVGEEFVYITRVSIKVLRVDMQSCLGR